jgi:hypothetical protein
MKAFIVLLFFAAIGCKVKQPVSEVQPIPRVVLEKLGKEVETLPNTSGKYILYVQKVDPKFPTHVVKAIVITSTNKIIMEESFVPGYIKWVSESSLEVLNMPGMIKKDEDLSHYTRAINLNSTKADL